MPAFNTFIYIIAYTVGIASISIQVLSYFKKLETKETLLFSISFLLLIFSFTLSAFSEFFNNFINILIERSKTLFLILLAVTTPLNIHNERIMRFSNTINKAFKIICGVFLILFVISNLINYNKEMFITACVLLNISILYSMMVIIFTKPSILVKHREKIEKTTAIIFFSILFLMMLVDIFSKKIKFSNNLLSFSELILPLFFIYLALLKLFDDIKRISLFSFKNVINTDKISVYNISPREKDVLDLLVKGKSYNQIGEDLFISLPTVKTHVSNIYRKFEVSNKVELINLLNSEKTTNSS